MKDLKAQAVTKMDIIMVTSTDTNTVISMDTIMTMNMIMDKCMVICISIGVIGIMDGILAGTNLGFFYRQQKIGPIPDFLLFYINRYITGVGVGVSAGVGVGIGVGVGVGSGVGVGVGATVGVAIGVGVGVGVTVGVAIGVGVGIGVTIGVGVAVAPETGVMIIILSKICTLLPNFSAIYLIINVFPFLFKLLNMS
jgi:hypothetical protein